MSLHDSEVISYRFQPEVYFHFAISNVIYASKCIYTQTQRTAVTVIIQSVPLPLLQFVVIYCNWFCFSVAITDLLASLFLIL